MERNMMIMIDKLLFYDHVESFSQSCYFHLTTGKIRSYLTKYATCLVQFLVISHLNFSNAHMAGVPVCAMKRNR